MLTPVDVQNKVFKGGIGFDKKDVEIFMKELSSDYEQLYRSNVELKDKVATLTESLQHYRSTEDSMQKALTLSEKTAEETIIAANDKARQINNEATKKAESILEGAKQELKETKDEIHRLKQLHAKFKAQYTKILQGQLQLIENKVVDIDLGEGYEMDSFHESEFGHNEGGLGTLGEGGGYTGTSSFDDRFERTNQEPAFNRGSLNTDPFADAANGGGRFSRQTGKGFIKNSTTKKSSNSTGDGKSTLNVKKTNSGSTKVKRNFTAAAQKQTSEHISQGKPADSVSSVINQTVSKKEDEPQSAVKPSEFKQETTQSVKSPLSDSDIKNESQTTQAVKDGSHKDDFRKEDSFAGEVENHMDESTLIGNDDDNNEGFNFMEDSSDNTSFENSLHSEASASTESSFFSDDVISGEVEEPVNESTMLDSEDNYNEGFSFVSDDDTASASANTFSEEDDIAYAGEVEDKVNESTMLDSEDNYNEGFDFVVGNESEEEDIPTISSDSASNLNLDSLHKNPKSDDNDVLAGDVEDPAGQSNLIGNTDDDSDGFNFL